jgi:hypothetical protein
MPDSVLDLAAAFPGSGVATIDSTPAVREAERAFAAGRSVAFNGPAWVFGNPLVLSAERFSAENAPHVSGNGGGGSFLIPLRPDLPTVVIEGGQKLKGKREWYGHIHDLGILHAMPPRTDKGENLIDAWLKSKDIGEYATGLRGHRTAPGIGIYVPPDVSLNAGSFRNLWLLTKGPGLWFRHHSFSFVMEGIQAWSHWGPSMAFGGGIGAQAENCYARACGPGCAGWEVVDWAALNACNGVDGLSGSDAWLMVGAIQPFRAKVLSATETTVTIDGTHADTWRKYLAVTVETGAAADITRRITANKGGALTVQRPWPGAVPKAGDSVWIHSELSAYHPDGGYPDGWWYKSGQVAVEDSNIEDCGDIGVVTRRPSSLELHNMRWFPNGRPMTRFMQLAGGAGAELWLTGKHHLGGRKPTSRRYIEVQGTMGVLGQMLPPEFQKYRDTVANVDVAIANQTGRALGLMSAVAPELVGPVRRHLRRAS